MEGAKQATGGNPHEIGLMSFTRAARQEAAERAGEAWGIDPDSLTKDGWIRTGHSICYRQLGVQTGQLLTDSKADQGWVAECFGVRLSTTLDENSANQVWIGDARVAWSLNAWQYHRVTLMPLDEVIKRMREYDPEDAQDISEVQSVAEQYESSKRLDDRCDFTDLLLRFAGVSCSPKHGIGRVKPEGELPPVTTWLFDEQQDASPLLDLVCRRLLEGAKVRFAYAVGDPFQSIYGFAGSSSECFMGWQVSRERTMPKSYRCPAKILDYGEMCLRKMTRSGGYWDRGVAPSGGEGKILNHYDIEEMSSIVKGDDDWLLLARTNYHVSRISGYLASIGIPCRSTRSNAEPTLRGIGMSALFKLENNQPVTGEEWSRAIAILPSRSAKEEIVKRGWKKKWKDQPMAAQWDVIFPEDLQEVGATAQLCSAIASGDWCGLVDHGTAWRKSAKKYGPDLASAPKVRVGTIHSAKGMQAENVAVLTTTSQRVQRASEIEEQYNEECRLAYVAATRSSRNLHIIEEAGLRKPRMEAFA